MGYPACSETFYSEELSDLNASGGTLFGYVLWLFRPAGRATAIPVM